MYTLGLNPRGQTVYPQPAVRIVPHARSPSHSMPTPVQRLPPQREVTQQQWVLAHEKLEQEKKQLETRLKECQHRLHVLEREKADAVGELEEIRDVALKNQRDSQEMGTKMREIQKQLRSIEAQMSRNQHELQVTQRRLQDKDAELTRIRELSLNYLKGIRSRLDAEIPSEFKHSSVLGHNTPDLMGNIHSDILDDIAAIRNVKKDLHKTLVDEQKRYSQLAVDCNKEKVETLTGILEAMHKDFPSLSKAETRASKSQNPAELVTKIVDKLHKIHDLTTVHDEVSASLDALYHDVKKKHNDLIPVKLRELSSKQDLHKIQAIHIVIHHLEQQVRTLTHSSSNHHAEIKKHTNDLASIKSALAGFETKFIDKIAESDLTESNGIFRTFTRDKKTKFAAKCAHIAREILDDIIKGHSSK